MISNGRRASFLLFIGDVAALAASLYLTLWLRYLKLPGLATFEPYLIPFSVLFAVWILVFYSSGLYSKRAVLFPSRLPDAVFRTQLVNMMLAALFFFLVPSFGIAPKTILVLYLLVSLVLILVWRLMGYPRLSSRQTRTYAILLARGGEADELFAEVNGNPRYGVEFIAREIGDERAAVYVVDAEYADASVDRFATFDKQIVTFEDFYEEVFDRVPLSKLEQPGFREHLMMSDPLWYSMAKRTVDVIGGLLMGCITILITPLVALALQLEYPGPVFIAQTRIGQNGSRIRAYKFRSMRFGDRGAWKGEDENMVTKVGGFLRKVSLDEFPQFVNILMGELSLIGPRNDVEALGLRLANALPYYMLRYRVRPGITGWAQINQQYEQGNASPQSIEETKVRLAYDFYYLRHRSFGLDVVIALKTIKRMFFRLSAV
jgi:lipopolysaccharide/colanic/teichoic acid biosynthesis glycosyltransferase